MNYSNKITSYKIERKRERRKRIKIDKIDTTRNKVNKKLAFVSYKRRVILSSILYSFTFSSSIVITDVTFLTYCVHNKYRFIIAEQNLAYN